MIRALTADDRAVWEELFDGYAVSPPRLNGSRTIESNPRRIFLGK